MEAQVPHAAVDGDKEREPSPERMETAHLRHLPHFVIIGAQRGGTTSLYRYLTEHPDVGPAWRKEVHFFDHNYAKGMNWYRAHFPRRDEAQVAGEASPNYLFHPAVPERSARALPNAKFIALLRNPVDRAFSHYHMMSRRGIEALSFEDAIDQEDQRLSASDDPGSLAWRHYSYLRRGLYEDQIRNWLRVFPRDRLLILKSEDLYQRPEQVCLETQTYLGLSPCSPQRTKAYHLADYPDMNPATRDRLRAHFAPHNRRLYDLVGRDFGWDHE